MQQFLESQAQAEIAVFLSRNEKGNFPRLPAISVIGKAFCAIFGTGCNLLPRDDSMLLGAFEPHRALGSRVGEELSVVVVMPALLCARCAEQT